MDSIDQPVNRSPRTTDSLLRGRILQGGDIRDVLVVADLARALLLLDLLLLAPVCLFRGAPGVLGSSAGIGLSCPARGVFLLPLL